MWTPSFTRSTFQGKESELGLLPPPAGTLLSPRQLPLQVTLPTLPSLLCPVLTSRPHSLLLEGDGTDWSKSFFVLLALGMGTGGCP